MAVPVSVAQQSVQAAGKAEVDVAVVEVPRPRAGFSLGLDVPNILFRNVQLPDIVLTSSSPAAFADPYGRKLFSLWAADTTIADVLKRYNGVRGDFELTLVINGAALTFGLYAATMVSNGVSIAEMASYRNATDKLQITDTSTAGIDARSVPQDSCAWINPAESKTIVFDMPYISPFAYYRTAPMSEPYFLVVQCYQPVQSATNVAAQTVTIRQFLRLKPGATMAALVPQSKAISGGLHTMGDVAAALGYSRESRPVAMTAVVRRGANYMSQFDGEENIERIGLFSVSRLAPDGGDCAASPDDTLFESLCKRPSAVAFPAIATTNVQFDVLATIPVTPFFGAALAGGTRPADNQYPPVAGYVGLPFEFWHGDMVYDIIVPASAIHRCGLQVLWVPPSPAPWTLAGTAKDTATLANAVVDVTGPTRITVRVPMGAPTYACRSFLTKPDQADYTEATQAPYANGSLVIRMSAALVSQSAQNIQCVVLAHAENMKFWGPKRYFRAKPITSSLPNYRGPWNYVLQSAQQADLMVTNQVELGRQLAEMEAEKVFGGDVPLSVRAIVQYPVRYATILNQAVAKYEKQFDRWPVASFASPPAGNFGVPTKSGQVFSWAGYYSAMFVGFRGSTKDRFICTRGYATGVTPRDLANANIVADVSTWNNPATGGTVETDVKPTLSGTIVPMTSGSSWEFEIPWRFGDMSFWPSRFVQWNSALSLLPCEVVTYTFESLFDETTACPTVYMYRSFGDDVSFMRFRRCPALYSQSS